MTRTVFIFCLCLGSLFLPAEVEAQTQEQEKTSTTEQLDKIITVLELNVEGMSCQAGCADGIDHMLSQQKGIINNKTTYATSTSVIRYDEKVISGKKIIELITDRGFRGSCCEG
ncbi:MAG: heavy metal-associated domain-containing protein [Bacteroidia bacterium]